MDNIKESEHSDPNTSAATCGHDATREMDRINSTKPQSDERDPELKEKNEGFEATHSAEATPPILSIDTAVAASNSSESSSPPSSEVKVMEADESPSRDTKPLYQSDEYGGETKVFSETTAGNQLQATAEGSELATETTPLVTIVTEPGATPSLAIVTKSKKGENKKLSELLSDAGQFSYASVCAIALSSLFKDSHNRQWAKKCMDSIIIHLKLPSQVESAMNAFLEGFGKDNIDSLINTLLEEPVLHRNTILLAEDLVTLALKDGIYDSRMRVLIFHVAWLMRVKWEHLEKFEQALLESLETTKENETEEEKNAKAKKEKRKKVKRYALIGLATIGGGAAIGLTAGLAAPLIAAGVGAVIGGTSAAVLGTTAAAAIMGSLFGAAGAGLTGYKMKKRIGAIEEFDFDRLTEGHHLHITIAISGWLSDSIPDNFHKPWASLSISKEQYCLRWESSYLLDLGRAIEYILSGVMSFAASEALKLTILSGILTALAWPASLLSVSSMIDNPWSVAISRATEVGKHLATVLLSRQQGRRPVTLIGFSLGARVIFYCLEEMAKHKGCEGIIEDVILLGAPVTGNPKAWKSFSKVVAGRIINGYCRGDWLLQFVYRTASVQMNIAGLRPIDWNERRMVNVDLSHLVSGHTDYWKRMNEILEAIGVNSTAFSRSRRPSLQGQQQDGGQTKETVDMPANYEKSLAITDHSTSLEDVKGPILERDGSDVKKEMAQPTEKNKAEFKESWLEVINDGIDVVETAKPNTKDIQSDIKENLEDANQFKDKMEDSSDIVKINLYKNDESLVDLDEMKQGDEKLQEGLDPIKDFPLASNEKVAEISSSFEVVQSASSEKEISNEKKDFFPAIKSQIKNFFKTD